ncbi:PREDICTED: anther-specific proline-rich protein APG-like [Nicotiana attenuata]|uniref:anther-specific proline-rich protein APG-like n=1 Tax=Nicotiana attenuata TaxID=49451 RepID=UPI00090583D3|nr:PREDICTED: anther-specific proline-rich protein APG-like [Nicotiana attenuata]
MDGDGPHGPCMLVQHPSELARHSDNTTRDSISSPTSDGGQEVGYEQLLEPSLAEQYTSTPSPVSEPTVDPCNEEPMKPPSPFQSNIPTECLMDMPFFMPENISELKPILLPWEQPQQPQEPPTPPPPPSQPQHPENIQ